MVSPGGFDLLRDLRALGVLPVEAPDTRTTGTPVPGQGTGAAVPPARYCQAMVFDGQQVVLFGGAPTSISDGARLGDTWAFRGGAWHPLRPAASPSPRALMSSAFDGRRVVIFGGSGDGNRYLDETWAFDGTTWAQIPTTTSPSPRRATMVSDGRRIVLFGGYDGKTVHDDAWTFDGKTWTRLRPASSPPARFAATMAFDGRDRASKRRAPIASRHALDGPRSLTPHPQPASRGRCPVPCSSAPTTSPTGEGPAATAWFLASMAIRVVTIPPMRATAAKAGSGSSPTSRWPRTSR
jgi:hypothetical protein